MANKFECPHCGVSKYVTVKSGSVTRCCGRRVVRVNGHIYARREDAPEWQIVQRFIEHRCKELPMFDIPMNGTAYQEAVTAASMLMDKCNGDVDLALASVDVCFNDSQHKWRSMISLFNVVSGRYFPDVKARARLRVETIKELEYRQGVRSSDLADPLWTNAYEAARQAI